MYTPYQIKSFIHPKKSDKTNKNSKILQLQREIEEI